MEYSFLAMCSGMGVSKRYFKHSIGEQFAIDLCLGKIMVLSRVNRSVLYTAFSAHCG